jgi:VanZ family protein
MLGNPVKRNLFASVFALLIVGSMALFFNLYEPWQPIGPELIPDGSFNTPVATNGWSGWNEWTRLEPDGGFNHSPGVVLTCSSNQHGILRFTAYDLKNIPAFRVSMRAAAKGIVKGKEGYHVPRAIFFYNDANARSLFSLHHGIMDISKDTGWRRYTDFFPVPEGAANARFQIQNLGAAGVMQIDDISVVPVKERHSAPYWKLFFGTLWMAAFGFAIFALRPWTHRLGPLIMLVLVLIMVGIVTPGKLLDSTIEKSLHTAKSLIPKPVAPAAQSAKPAPLKTVTPAPTKPQTEPVIAPASTGVDQAHLIGHFGMFSLLALLSTLSWLTTPSLRRATVIYTELAFFATATEVLQFIPPDRSAGLSDLYVDMGGMAGAVIIVFVLRHIQRLIKP